MKLHRMITLSALASTLALSSTSLLAQDNPAPGAPGADQANGQGGGQRRNRQGGGPGGNWDPAQMQQRMVDGARDRLGFTNDTDWAAVEPLVKKVLAARMEVGMRGMMGGRTRGGSTGDQAGGNRPRTSMFGQSSPEQDALQKALDDNAPASQIKGLLAKYKAVQQAKQAKLEAAQADLKAVLTTKQEAQAFLLGLVN